MVRSALLSNRETGMKGKQDQHFGKLIVDFVNAPTPEEAGEAFIRGASRAFGFSVTFLGQALESYPTMKRFGEILLPADREVVDLLLEERGLLSIINNLPCNISVASYDYDDTRTLTLKIQPLEPSWDNENPYEEDFFRVVIGAGERWLGEVAEMFDERAPLSEDMDEVKEQLLGRLKEYVELDDRILAVRRAIPVERMHAAQKMAAYHSRIQAEQEVLAELLERWRMILTEVMETEGLSRNLTLQDLLLVYNVVNKREWAVGEEGALYEKPLFDERYFTERAGLADEYYHNVLVYAFVEFLKIPGNRAKMGKCPSCGSFFIATSRRPTGARCPICRHPRPA